MVQLYLLLLFYMQRPEINFYKISTQTTSSHNLSTFDILFTCWLHCFKLRNNVTLFLQAEFTAMREQYMRGGEGFIICYSVTDRQSFQEAAKFKELIFQVRHTYEIPLVLVGNKIDLEQFRQVSATFFYLFVLNSKGTEYLVKYGCFPRFILRIMRRKWCVWFSWEIFEILW